MSGDLLAVVLGTTGALAATWTATEVRDYLLWVRGGRGGQGPSRWRLRGALYVGCAVLGGLLGLALGAWLRG